MMKYILLLLSLGCFLSIMFIVDTKSTQVLLWLFGALLSIIGVLMDSKELK